MGQSVKSATPAAREKRGRRALPLFREEFGDDIELADITCAACPSEHTCEFAWDLYNTGGDCLETK